MIPLLTTLVITVIEISTYTHILSADEGGPRTPTEKVKLTVR